MFGFVDEDDPLKKAKKKAQNTLEYSMSDLNGARVPVNAFMEADMSKANDTMKEMNDKLIDRLKREQKAYGNLETRRELAARFPALFLADKGVWNISTKVICAFKESYIVNLERELKKAENNSVVYDKKVEELEHLKNAFIKDKFCYTLCHIRFHISKCLGMFLYRIFPCNIKYGLRCILALFQKLMDTATHIFPGQKRFIQNLIGNGMP